MIFGLSHLVNDWGNGALFVTAIGGLFAFAWRLNVKMVLKLTGEGSKLDSIDKAVNNKGDDELTLREMVKNQGIEQARQAKAMEVMQAELAANTAATVRVDRKVDEHIAFHKGKEAAGADH